MTLAVDVRASLDLTGPVTAALGQLQSILGEDADLAALLGGSAEVVITGDLLSTLEHLGTGDLIDTDTLLQPLTGALTLLLDELDIGTLGTLEEMVDAIGLVKTVASSIDLLLSEDIAPLDLGRELGLSMGDAVNLVLDNVGLPNELAPVDDLRGALEVLDGIDNTGSAAELVATIADLLLPVGADVLRPIRAHVDLLEHRLAALPAISLEGPIVAYTAALAAVAPGDPPQELNLARDALDAAIGEAIALANASLDALECQAWTTRLRTVLAAVPTIPSFSIDSLTTEFAAEISSFGAQLTDTTEQQILDGIERMRLDALAFLDAQLGPIPALLDEGEARLLEVLAGLPHHRFRAQLQELADELSDRVLALGIDDVPEAIDAALADVRDVVTGDIVGSIQAGAAEIVDKVTGVVGRIETVLMDLQGALSTAVDEVGDVLGRVRDAIAGFRSQIETVEQLSGEIDLTGAAAEVRANVDELAEAVSALLSGDLLPDAVRPVLEQAADAIADLDLGALLVDPATDAVGQLQVELPPEVKEALEDAAELLREILPQSVLAEIDQPVEAVAEALAAFNPLELLAGLSEALDQAQQAVESLDPAPHLGPLNRIFEDVLTRFDQLDPTLLLDPLASGYDEILSVMERVNPEAVGDQIFGGFEQATETLQEVVTTATRRIGSESSSEPETPLSDLPPPEPPPDDRPAPLFRPGDGVRALGSILDRIREAIEPVDDGILLPAFNELHEITHGLAARLAPEQMLGVARTSIEALTAPLETAAVVPAGGSLVLAWEGASSRADIELRYHPIEVLGLHRGDIEALRDRVRACCEDLAGSQTEAAALATSLTSSVARAFDTGADDRGPIDALLSQLDVEPIAASLDLVVNDAATAVLNTGTALNEALETMRNDIDARLAALGPRQMMIRMARIAAKLRDELDVMNPRNLAADVRPVFIALRSQLEAWSPASLTAGLTETLQSIAEAIRSLRPEELLGDLGDLDDVATQVLTLRPSELLQPVALVLGELGDELAELDLDAAISLLVETTADLIADLGVVLEEVQGAIVDLLRQLGSNADVSVSIQLEVSTG